MRLPSAYAIALLKSIIAKCMDGIKSYNCELFRIGGNACPAAIAIKEAGDVEALKQLSNRYVELEQFRNPQPVSIAVTVAGTTDS